MIDFFLLLTLSYLIGAIPFSIIVAKQMGGIDIRQYGSGNAGGTNTFRVLGFKAGLLVTILDVGKAALVAGVLAKYNFFDLNYPFEPVVVSLSAGIAAVIGHILPVYVGFKGGKGVACGGGMILGVSPILFLIIVSIFAFLLITTRYVSLSSMIASCSAAFMLKLLESQFAYTIPTYLFEFSIAIGIIIVVAHYKNIKRLINGTENRIKPIFGKQ